MSLSMIWDLSPLDCNCSSTSRDFSAELPQQVPQITGHMLSITDLWLLVNFGHNHDPRRKLGASIFRLERGIFPQGWQKQFLIKLVRFL